MSDHEVRDLQYRLKQAHKQLGKQGETIHRLRCEVTSLHALTDPEDRHRMHLWLNGSMRQKLTNKIEEQADTINDLRSQIDRLCESNYQLKAQLGRVQAIEKVAEEVFQS